MGTLFNSPTTREPRSGDIPVWDAKIRQWVPSNRGQSISLSAALPAVAKNDDEFVYQAATGVFWTFKYDSASAYWNFVGGPPLTAFHLSGSGGFMVSSATWTDAGTNGPQITPPFAGDYIADIMTRIDNNSASTPTMSFFAASPVGSAPGGTIGAISLTNTAGTNFFSGGVRNMLLSLTAGVKVDIWGWTAAAASTSVVFSSMAMTLIPTRVH